MCTQKKKDSNKLLRALARTLINKHGEWKEFYGWDWFSNSQNDQNILLEIFARVIRQAQTTCNESNICILKKEYANFEGNKSAGNVSVSDVQFCVNFSGSQVMKWSCWRELFMIKELKNVESGVASIWWLLAEWRGGNLALFLHFKVLKASELLNILRRSQFSSNDLQCQDGRNLWIYYCSCHRLLTNENEWLPKFIFYLSRAISPIELVLKFVRSMEKTYCCIQ